MAFSLWTWACDELKPTTGQGITLRNGRYLIYERLHYRNLYNGTLNESYTLIYEVSTEGTRHLNELYT